MAKPNPFKETETLFAQANQRLAELTAMIEAGRARLLDLERSNALSQIDQEALAAFLQKPYLLRPIRGDRHELIIPKFVNFRAGWPVRADGEYLIFEVSRFIDFLSPLPEWLRSELGYENPAFQAHLEGDKLIIDQGDPTQVWQQLGGGKNFSTRRGNELRVRPKSRFDLIRDLVRQGILPYTPQPIPDDLLRYPLTTIELRPEQSRDYKTFLELGAVSIFATGGAGKTFFGMYAAAAIKGRKVVLAPRRAILDQWKARMAAYCGEEVLAETEFRTYQSLTRRPLQGEYSLIIYDEIQHLPADMGVAAAEAQSVARIGLSATPWREDGHEDIIPALAGQPVGFDWPSGEPAETTVWVIDRAEDKLPLIEQLVEKPIQGKTMIFVYRLQVGEEIAKQLGIPFVSGQTKDQLDVMQRSDTFVISKVGDSGISLEAERVIEADFLGGRMEAGQRALRTQHAANRGEFHVIMTADEYQRHSRRLVALYALGFDVQVVGGKQTERDKKPRNGQRRRQPKAKQPSAAATTPPSSRRGNQQQSKALDAKIERARAAVERPAYVDKVFNACSQAPLTPKEIAEALGAPSKSTIKRVEAAAWALASQDLLIKNGDRFEVNQQEIQRLKALESLKL